MFSSEPAVKSSYATGKRSRNSEGIPVDDKSLEVQPNLFDALMALRSEEGPQYFWINAVCVKQIDDEEKSDQISYMHEVYTNASRVVIWLGTTGGDSDYFTESIHG